MKASTVQIVTATETHTVPVAAVFELVRALRLGDVVGVKRSRRGGMALREEIEGMPIFSRLCGPMYGGEGVARYETAEVNDRLSF